MERRQRELVGRISRILRERGIPAVENFDLGGVRTDLVVRAPDGRLFVVEAKAFRPTGVNLDAAMRQVELFRTELGAAQAYVVVDRLDFSIPEKGVFSEADFSQIVVEQLAQDMEPRGKILTKSSLAEVATRKTSRLHCDALRARIRGHVFRGRELRS